MLKTKLGQLAATLLLAVSLGATATADPLITVDYTTTNTGGTNYTYDFGITYLSCIDPYTASACSDSDAELWGIDIHFDPLQIFNIIDVVLDSSSADWVSDIFQPAVSGDPSIPDTEGLVAMDYYGYLPIIPLAGFSFAVTVDVGDYVGILDGPFLDFFTGYFDVYDIEASGSGFATNGTCIDNINCTVDVPEPATIALFGIGLFGLGMARRRKLKI